MTGLHISLKMDMCEPNVSRDQGSHLYSFRIFLNHSANICEIQRLTVRHFGYDSELVTSILHSSSSWALENVFKALCNPFPEKHYGGR